ncbi:MAG: DNA primase [bacterium]
MRGRLSNEQIEEIISRNDLVEVIGGYISLKPSGKNFKGLCPFHQEKTPSFMVNRERGLWHCFGCGQGGNLLTFLMNVEKMTFPEAIQLLARKAGISLELRYDDEEARRRDRLLSLLNEAGDFFKAALNSGSPGRFALEYLRKRQIHPETAAVFRLGYAPGMGDSLIKHLRERGYAIEEIVMSGLAFPQKEEKKPWDYFRHRLMFPIMDLQGRIIAFGGRAFDEGGPKYLNTPESPLFSKGKTLYGLHLAKSAISGEDQALVVEGYLDVVSIHQAGFVNVVASMGTALTAQQVQLLRRFSRNAILAYDADSAGFTATLRGIEIFEQAALSVKVLQLPRGEDPDSVIREKGASAFGELIKKARGVIDYKIRTTAGKYDLKSPEGKADFIREILPTLAQIEDHARRDLYLRKISQDLGVSEEVIRGGLRPVSGGGRALSREVVLRSLKSSSPEERLLRIMLASPEVLQTVRDGLLNLDEIEDESWRKAYEVVFRARPLRNEDWGDTSYSREKSDENSPVRFSDLMPLIEDEALASRLSALVMDEELRFSGEEVGKLVQKIRESRMLKRLSELEKEVTPLIAQGSLSREDPRFQEYLKLTQYFKGMR